MPNIPFQILNEFFNVLFLGLLVLIWSDFKQKNLKTIRKLPENESLKRIKMYLIHSFIPIEKVERCLKIKIYFSGMKSRIFNSIKTLFSISNNENKNKSIFFDHFMNNMEDI